MACKYCEPVAPGGYECPVCGCDYCLEHYKQHVSTKLENDHFIENDVCQLCGDEL